MKKRLLYIGIIGILILIVIQAHVIFAADTSITVNQDNNVSEIIVKSDKKIILIKIYKKLENGKYNLFYIAKPYKTEKTCKISKEKLSEEKSTQFKIVIIDEEHNKATTNFELEKIQKPSYTPVESPEPNPSNSPSPTNSVVPTNSSTPSPSNTPMPSNQPSPSTSPEQTVTGIKLNKTTLKLKASKSETLSATITPKDAKDKTVTWSSNNTKIATVDKNGKVKAKAVGTATITAKTSNNQKATCKVTVVPNISSSTKPKSASGNGYTQTIKLGGRTFKLYKQYSGNYAQKHFNSVNNKNTGGTIANMGCGPSSIAIILSGYGYNYNPYDVGTRLMKNSKPSGLPSMEKELKSIGVKVKKHSYTSNYNTAYTQMKQALESGHQIVLYVGKNGQKTAWKNFTDSGYHFISVLGIDTSDNKVFVGNPSKASGWFKLSTVVKARGNTNGNMAGWIEIY